MAQNVCRCFGKVLSSKVYRPLLVSAREVKRHVAPTIREINKRNSLYRKSLDPKKLAELERRSNFREWNYEAEIYAFGKRLSEDFDLALLTLAFTNKSYFNKESLSELDIRVEDINFRHNEALAEEGGRVISDHVWNYACHSLPRFPREGIEGIHDHLTSVETLAAVSKNLGTTHLILSDEYPVGDETYATTLKAVVGALKESRGIERANLLVRDIIVTQLAGKDVNDFLVVSSYFRALEEIAKRDGFASLEPRIIFRSAKNDILANFHVGIYRDRELIGHCSGESIDVAVEMAALDALKRLFRTTDSSEPLRYDRFVAGEGKSHANVPLAEWSSSRFAT